MKVNRSILAPDRKCMMYNSRKSDGRNKQIIGDLLCNEFAICI